MAGGVVVEAYDWSGRADSHRVTRSAHPGAPPTDEPPLPAEAPKLGPVIDRFAMERDAFAEGFSQGERAGQEAAAARAEQVLRRLAQTIEELQGLRTDLLQRAERQVVQLAIAIARRIVHRELQLDRELMTAMTRVALDRLSDAGAATIRLHPEDYAATVTRTGASPYGSTVSVVADSVVRRGGCMVQSDLGAIDLCLESQIQELADALLGSDPLPAVGAEVRLAK